jgi:hypothetical protein
MNLAGHEAIAGRLFRERAHLSVDFVGFFKDLMRFYYLPGN